MMSARPVMCAIDDSEPSVEAATGIARIVSEPEAARAVPAVLGCIETALQELSNACTLLREPTSHHRGHRTSEARPWSTVSSVATRI